jgi:hypothetical protein
LSRKSIWRATGTDNAGKTELQAVLVVAATVWNAMVEEGGEVDDALADISEDVKGWLHPRRSRCW